ncbi:LysR family transcriptional regulator [Comamonas sp. JC664]|uniref:LysR family transcriptional regulator n=1 Tax=Comamonas sp. JC664 TaxID=2801917 RepID=UPI003609F234
MDFKQLKAFLTVADTGSVTRASELLHVVQPAVSRQLKLLEEDLGCALFERERHGMVLTEQGQELASYARRAFGELEKARLQLAGTQDEVTGLVHHWPLAQHLRCGLQRAGRRAGQPLPGHQAAPDGRLRRHAQALAGERPGRCGLAVCG